MIAVKNDIFDLNEALEQLHEKNRQSKLIKQFLIEAKPILTQEQDSLKLISRLLEVVAYLRKAISPNDRILNETLDGIQFELLSIQTLLLPNINDSKIIPTIISTLRLSKTVTLRFFGGSFLALLICLGLYFWPSFKQVIAET